MKLIDELEAAAKDNLIPVGSKILTMAKREDILKLCAMVRMSDKALHHYSIGRHFILRDGEQIEDGLIAREALKKLRGEE